MRVFHAIYLSFLLCFTLATQTIFAQVDFGENDFLISNVGARYPIFYNAYDPAIAFNGSANEYLVAWTAPDDGHFSDYGQYEVYVQRFDALTMTAIGSPLMLTDDAWDDAADAEDPAVVYNSIENEYLVVWTDDELGVTDNEFEVFGQRIDAATGNLVGTNQFRISDMGPDYDYQYDARQPAVAFNSTDNEYLVVWYGNETHNTYGEPDQEIYCQRLDGATGAEIGVNDFPISEMDVDADDRRSGIQPTVVYNSNDNEYLVAWAGDDESLANDEYEIFVQRVSATGAEVGYDDFRISGMGPNGDRDYDAYSPSVTHNTFNNHYAVVWYGNHDLPGLHEDEEEIYMQRLSNLLLPIGTDDQRISTTGTDGDSLMKAERPNIIYNPDDHEYLVAWRANELYSPVWFHFQTPSEIYVQRIHASNGAELGTNDQRISDMGADDNEGGLDAFNPVIAYNSTDGKYMVTWFGDDDTDPLIASENEIFGQHLDAQTGAETGTNDQRLTYTGADADHLFYAYSPSITYNSTNDEFLVVWYGTDHREYSTFDHSDSQVYGKRIDAATGNIIGQTTIISAYPWLNYSSDEAYTPDVVYNSTDNQYLVVWRGSDYILDEMDYEFEIYGQIIDDTLGKIGTKFYISQMGGTGASIAEEAKHPAVAYDPTGNFYLVVWSGEENIYQTGEKFDIHGQFISAAGTEIGPDDFRISDMGTGVDYDGVEPDVAYNSTDGTFHVVWSANDDAGGMISNEEEIFHRIITANGIMPAPAQRISDMGGVGNTGAYASRPSIAYNSTNNDLLVVWSSTDPEYPGLDYYEREIWGQRLDGSGVEIGANDFRISDMGPDGDANHIASGAQVVYNPTDNEYLVAWSGDNTLGTQFTIREDEVYAQRIDGATGAEIGINDQRVSDMGPDLDHQYDASSAGVAYSVGSDTYLAVWSGDDDTAPQIEDEYEIWGQLIITCDAPVAQCQPTTISLDLDGSKGIDAADIDMLSYSNCGELDMMATPNMFNCGNMGDNTVSLIVTDQEGQKDTCLTTVTVNLNEADTAAPVAICAPFTDFLIDGVLNANGEALAQFSHDNCGVDTFMVSPAVFTCADVGQNNVTVTVADKSGNTDSCTTTLEVLDWQAPNAICHGTVISLDANGEASITTGDADDGSYDDCGIASMSLDITEFNCSNIGSNMVHLSVTDVNGNVSNCAAFIEVEDNMAPTAVCQNFTVALDGNGDAFITGADVAPNSSDNCTINEVKVDPDEFDCTSVGQHTVDVIVFDGEGNTDNCQAVVTVDDSGPTFSNCPADIVSMNDLGNCFGPVFWFEPTALDNCGLVASITSTHVPNDTFQVGVTQVIYTATDDSNNESYCIFNVEMMDAEEPVFLDCPNDDINTCSPVTAVNPPIAADNCNVANVVKEVDVIQTFTTIETTFTYTATDDAGNEGVCGFKIVQHNLPKADAGPDTTITEGNAVQIGGTPTGLGGTQPYSYLWAPAEDMLDNTDSNPVVAPTQTETYIVFVIDANGCAGTDQVVVTVNQAIDDDNQSKNETPGFDMALFPNPASEFVTVSFVSENEEVAPINIFDMSGKLVQSMPLEMAIGQNSLHLEIAHLPAGTYQVELRTAPKTQTQKLVIAD